MNTSVLLSALVISAGGIMVGAATISLVRRSSTKLRAWGFVIIGFAALGLGVLIPDRTGLVGDSIVLKTVLLLTFIAGLALVARDGRQSGMK